MYEMWEKFGACKTIKRAITEFELHCMDFCSLKGGREDFFHA